MSMDPSDAIGLPILNGVEPDCEEGLAVEKLVVSNYSVSLYNFTHCYGEDALVDSFLRIVIEVKKNVWALCDVFVSRYGVRSRYSVSNSNALTLPHFVDGAVGIHLDEVNSSLPTWLIISEASISKKYKDSSKFSSEGCNLPLEICTSGIRRIWCFFSQNEKPPTFGIGQHDARVDGFDLSLVPLAEAFVSDAFVSILIRDGRLRVTVGDLYERLSLRAPGSWTLTLYVNEKPVDVCETRESLSEVLLVPSFDPSDSLSVSFSRLVPGYDDPVVYRYGIHPSQLEVLAEDNVRVGVRIENDILKGCIAVSQEHIDLDLRDLVVTLLVEGIPKYCQRVSSPGFFTLPLRDEWRSRMISVRAKGNYSDRKEKVDITSSMVPHVVQQEDACRFSCVSVLNPGVSGKNVHIVGSGPSASESGLQSDDFLVCVNGSMGALAPSVSPDYLLITDQTLIENSAVAEHSRSSLQGRHVATVVAITKKLELSEVALKLSEAGLTHDNLIEMPNQERLDLAGRLFNRVIPPSPGNKLACSAGVTAMLLLYFSGAKKINVSGFDFGGGHFHSPNTKRAHAAMDLEAFELLRHEYGVLELAQKVEGKE